MTRLILSLEDRERAWLERRSRETGESMAEIIRRAIRQSRQVEEESLEEALEATRGLWKNGDGLKYQRKTRREWK